MKAFPIPKDVLGLDYCGMNLRDYFAAKAMQAYFTDEEIIWDIEVLKIGAERAYILADAMMEARNEKS